MSKKQITEITCDRCKKRIAGDPAMAPRDLIYEFFVATHGVTGDPCRTEYGGPTIDLCEKCQSIALKKLLDAKDHDTQFGKEFLALIGLEKMS